MEKQINELINIAKEIAKNNDCCKYSNFSVGAALLTVDEKIYKGFNIENDGIQSICAERAAFCNALVDGAREFKSMVVVGKRLKDDLFIKTLPCGYCRQFIREYTNDDFVIYTYDDENHELFEYKIVDLLPESFKF